MMVQGPGDGVRVRDLPGRSPSGPDTARRTTRGGATAGVDDEMPPDVPPPIGPPAAYRRPASVAVSARFISRLKREYFKDGDGRTRRIGRSEDVRAWLAGLKIGLVRPK